MEGDDENDMAQIGYKPFQIVYRLFELSGISREEAK